MRKAVHLVRVAHLPTVVTLTLAALFIAFAAWLSFPIPGTNIPQTGQTVAVLTVGALLGPGLGAAAVVLYLLLGALGLPVYSDGGSGWSVLFGSSVGYFGGFVVAAALLGFISKSASRFLALKTVQLLIAMLVGHGVILLCGFVGLAAEAGVATAWEQGVAPFIYGGVIKSIISVLLILMVEPLRPIFRLRLIQEQ